MRRAVFEIISIAAAVAVGFLSFRTAEAGYYNPHLASYDNVGVMAASIQRAIIQQALIAAAATWLALRLVGSLLAAWLRRIPAPSTSWQIATALLVLPTVAIAVMSAGYGDEYQFQDRRLLVGYYATALAAVVLVRLRTRSTDRKQAATGMPYLGGIRAFQVAAAAVALAYPIVASSRALGSTPSEVRFSEAMLAAARAGTTELRLADHAPAARDYACLVDDDLRQNGIRESIGVDYRGPLAKGSDTYQVVLVGQDGNGYTMRMIVGRITPEPGDPVCVPLATAYIQLMVEQPIEQVPAIRVRWARRH